MRIILAAVMTVMIASPSALAVQTRAGVEAPWFGTWKLNLAKSTYDPGPPPFKRITCRIEPWEDAVKVTYDMVRTRGGITHLEWTGKFDGRDYAVEGVDSVATNAYSRIDDRAYEVILKVDDEVSATARMTISPDGKALTMATLGMNGQRATTVYDRQ